MLCAPGDSWSHSDSTDTCVMPCGGDINDGTGTVAVTRRLCDGSGSRGSHADGTEGGRVGQSGVGVHAIHPNDIKCMTAIYHSYYSICEGTIDKRQNVTKKRGILFFVSVCFFLFRWFSFLFSFLVLHMFVCYNTISVQYLQRMR